MFHCAHNRGLRFFSGGFFCFRYSMFVSLYIILGVSEWRASSQVSVAVSPSDGSTWMADGCHGLYRFGKNGRVLHFSASDGRFGSDSVRTLFFDSKAVLWILDASSKLSCYTPVAGFKRLSGFPSPVQAAAYDSLSRRIFLSSGTTLYAYDTPSSRLSKVAELSSAPHALVVDPVSSALWAVSGERAERFSLSGNEESTSVEVSNPKDSDSDTSPLSAVPMGRFSWLYLALLLLLLLLLPVAFLLGRRARNASVYSSSGSSSLPVPSPLPVPENEELPSAAEPHPLTVSASGAFTKQVMSLIQEHLSDPDFDVSAIADLTGVSRIHVNRKLKLEGTPSPSILIRDMRMSRSQSLLLEGKLSVAQISSVCGFRSPSYFTTAFKEYTGMTPSEYVLSKQRF